MMGIKDRQGTYSYISIHNNCSSNVVLYIIMKVIFFFYPTLFVILVDCKL